MDATSIVAVVAAAQQLLDVAIKEKALLEAQDQATVDAALASLRTTSDAMHAAAQEL